MYFVLLNAKRTKASRKRLPKKYLHGIARAGRNAWIKIRVSGSADDPARVPLSHNGRATILHMNPLTFVTKISIHELVHCHQKKEKSHYVDLDRTKVVVTVATISSE